MAYIDRDKAIAFVEEQYRLFKDDDEKQAIVEGCIEALKFTPTADVEEMKHGAWIYSKTYYTVDECNCSLCGQLMTTAEGVRMNYCPNCGAKMDGK
jgi:hypothetical protein